MLDIRFGPNSLPEGTLEEIEDMANFCFEWYLNHFGVEATDLDPVKVYFPTPGQSPGRYGAAVDREHLDLMQIRTDAFVNGQLTNRGANTVMHEFIHFCQYATDFERSYTQPYRQRPQEAQAFEYAPVVLEAYRNRELEDEEDDIHYSPWRLASDGSRHRRVVVVVKGEPDRDYEADDFIHTGFVYYKVEREAPSILHEVNGDSEQTGPILELLNEQHHGRHNWRFVEDYTAYGTTIPAGFVTDLGSIPHFLWGIVGPQEIAHGAIIHDYHYVHQKIPRRKADDLLYQIIRQENEVGKVRATLVWLAVRVFGRYRMRG